MDHQTSDCGAALLECRKDKGMINVNILTPYLVTFFFKFLEYIIKRRLDCIEVLIWTLKK
jgi:hypothetical protein